jgi:hypothetical protein
VRRRASRSRRDLPDLGHDTPEPVSTLGRPARSFPRESGVTDPSECFGHEAGTSIAQGAMMNTVSRSSLRHASSIGWLLLSLMLLACGGREQTKDGAVSGNSAGNSSANTNTTTGGSSSHPAEPGVAVSRDASVGPGVSGSDCPSQYPGVGSTCANAAAVCFYNGEPCALTFRCLNGQWQPDRTPCDRAEDAPATPPPCPVTPPDLGAFCQSVPSQVCGYASGSCHGNANEYTDWECVAGQWQPGYVKTGTCDGVLVCPRTVPKAASPCPSEVGPVYPPCSYPCAGKSGGWVANCVQGMWRLSPISCTDGGTDGSAE